MPSSLKAIVSTCGLLLSLQLAACSGATECGPFYFETVNVAASATFPLQDTADTLFIVEETFGDSIKVLWRRDSEAIGQFSVRAYGKSIGQGDTLKPTFHIMNAGRSETLTVGMQRQTIRRGKKQIQCEPAADRVQFDSLIILTPAGRKLQLISIL